MSAHGFTSVFATELDGYLEFKEKMGFYGSSRISYLTLILQPASVGSVFGPDRSVSGGSLVSCRSGDGRCVLLSGCQAPIGGPSIVSGARRVNVGSLRWAWVTPQAKVGNLRSAASALMNARAWA